MTPSRDAIVATAREAAMRGSKGVALSSLLFDRATRERAWLLHAWCRRCYDLADGRDHGRVLHDDPEARVAMIAARTEAAIAGGIVGDPGFDALRLLVAETDMPPALPRDFVAGLAIDAEGRRPRTEADLMRYCRHVAGTVGRMTGLIMGVSPDDAETLDRADDLGRAFRLARIMRDLEEDDKAGRCYLPVEWLAEMDIPPGQHMKPPFRERLAVLVRRLGERAEELQARAIPAAATLGFRARWAVLTAAGIHGDLARRVIARGGHAWDHRARTGMAATLGRAARGFGEALRG